MLYLYDQAILEDLLESFSNNIHPTIKCVSSEEIVNLAAQLNNDHIEYPLICIIRAPNTPIDNNLLNFTRTHFGVCTVMDKQTNILYYEQAIPVQLEYALTVLTPNTSARDELIRELLFKYSTQYFLSIRCPYESNRLIRFGIRVDTSKDIEYSSGIIEYLEQGKLYQTIIPLICDGAVLLNYRPVKLKRNSLETSVS